MTAWGAKGAEPLEELKALQSTIGPSLQGAVLLGALDMAAKHGAPPPNPRVLDSLVRLCEEAKQVPKMLALLDDLWSVEVQMEPETLAKLIVISMDGGHLTRTIKVGFSLQSKQTKLLFFFTNHAIKRFFFSHLVKKAAHKVPFPKRGRT